MASKEQVKIEYILDDKASSGFTKLAGKVLGVVGGITALVAGIKYSVQAYAEQEQAVTELNTALKNNGDYTEQNTKALQGQASALQKTTAFADEDIIAAQAQLAMYGLTTTQIQQVTAATLDLATKQGVDASTAAQTMGKSIGTTTNALGRMGIEVEGAAGSTERLGMALAGVNRIAGGQAAAFGTTLAGSMIMAKNAMGEVGETVGMVLAPYIAKAAQGISALAYKFAEFSQTESFAKFIVFTQGLLEGLVATLKVVWEWAGKIFDFFTQTADEKTAELDEKIAILQAKREEIIAKDEEMSARDEEKNAEMLAKIEELETQKAEILNTKAAEKEQTDAILQEQRNVRIATNNAKQVEAERAKQAAIDAMEKERAKNFDATLSYMATGMRSENKTIFEIAKAAALAQATMDAYRAVNVALASAPPPINFILAGATLAVGLDTVSRINSQQFAMADGGIINPQNGGVTAQIAEANGAEAVIPLDSQGGADALKNAVGGGGTTVVNIDGRPLAQHLYQVQKDMIRTGEIQE